MRQDPWRRALASYPLQGTLMPRFTDVDVWQHLNNTALITMHAEAAQQALAALLGPDAWRATTPAFGCVSAATDFLAEAYYPAPLAWGACVLAAGEGRVRVATALFQEAQCVGLHDAVLGCWAHGERVPPGPEQQQAIEAAGLPVIDALEAGGAPQALAVFPWRTELKVRFGDSDARRLASDAFLARCAEQMRVEFLGEAFGDVRERMGAMLVAHVTLRWYERRAPGARWQVGCAVSHVGERSLAVRGAMFDGEHCVATCESVMVAIDPATRRSAPLPAGTREALACWHVRPQAVANP